MTQNHYICLSHIDTDEHTRHKHYEKNRHFGRSRAVLGRAAQCPDPGQGCTLLQPSPDGDRAGERLRRRERLQMGREVLYVLHGRRSMGVFRHARLGVPLCGRRARRARRVPLQRQVLYDRQQQQRLGCRQSSRTVRGPGTVEGDTGPRARMEPGLRPPHLCGRGQPALPVLARNGHQRHLFRQARPERHNAVRGPRDASFQFQPRPRLGAPGRDERVHRRRLDRGAVDLQARRDLLSPVFRLGNPVADLCRGLLQVEECPGTVRVRPEQSSAPPYGRNRDRPCARQHGDRA